MSFIIFWLYLLNDLNRRSTRHGTIFFFLLLWQLALICGFWLARTMPCKEQDRRTLSDTGRRKFLIPESIVNCYWRWSILKSDSIPEPPQRSTKGEVSDRKEYDNNANIDYKLWRPIFNLLNQVRSWTISYLKLTPMLMLTKRLENEPGTENLLWAYRDQTRSVNLHILEEAITCYQLAVKSGMATN